LVILWRVYKFGGAAPPKGPNIIFRKSRFGWVRFHIKISVISWPKFTGLVSPNARGIAVDKIFIRFWISSSLSEIFAAQLRSRPKSCMFLASIFWGECIPEILDRHYKIGPSTNQRAKFYAGRSTHLGNLALKKITRHLGQSQLESARRHKFNWRKIRGEISPASKSRGPNSNALAYAERALST